jgi:hypothetical protein
MMAAAGFPQYLIAMYGGWTPDSQSLRIYAQPTDDMIELISRRMNELAEQDSSQHFIHHFMAIASSTGNSKG